MCAVRLALGAIGGGPWAGRIRSLLSNPALMRKMGEAGREHVRRNFLITRHLRDYLSLLVHLTA